MIKLCQSGAVSSRHVVTFNMDEYVGIPKDHPQSYHTFMWDNLFNQIDIPANAMTDCFVAELPANGVYLANLSLQDGKGKVISENSYWKKLGETSDFLALNKLAQVKLSGSILKKGNGSITFKVKNTSKIIAVSVKLNLRDKLTQKAILPAYFTDGYFNLLSGESKTIKVDYDPSLKLENLNISADGYNVEGIEVK